MNLSQLQTFVSVQLDDLNKTYFTAAQITVYLNNACREVQKLLLGANQNYYVKCVVTPLVSGQQSYALPQDFLQLNRLDIITNGTGANQTYYPVAPITINQQDMVATYSAGDPSYYFIQKNRLMLYPWPQTAYTLRLRYSYLIPNMVNESDVPDVPEQYHESVGYIACIDGLLRDGRDASFFLRKREELIERLKEDADERNKDVSRSIVVTDFGMGNNSYGFY